MAVPHGDSAPRQPAGDVRRRPPELLTLINAKRNLPEKSVLVYPDPPLGTRELDVLDGVGPSVESMSEWMRRDRDEE